ncbi:hypothetical protein ACFL1A_01915 [Patescibacteria group bacterium]
MKRYTFDEASIIATVCYADIFDYPLTEREVWKYLIGRKISLFKTKQLLSRLTEGNTKNLKKRFYYLSGKSLLVQKRINRNSSSSHKWIIASRVAKMLEIIPTIRLVGITGGLALNNADSGDDIDLFLIVSKGTLFVSRLAAAIFVEVFFRRRKPDDKNVTNAICMNMLITDDNLKLVLEDRNIFTAHEVVQMKPLWTRGNIYSRFIRSNTWIKKFLPNAWETLNDVKNKDYDYRIINKDNTIKKIVIMTFSLFEQIAKNIQLWYMRKRRTNEVVSDNILKFHPSDAKVWVERKFKKNTEKLNIHLTRLLQAV